MRPREPQAPNTTPDDDRLFGKTLLREVVISPDQLKTAIACRQEMRRQGVMLRLGERRGKVGFLPLFTN